MQITQAKRLHKHENQLHTQLYKHKAKIQKHHISITLYLAYQQADSLDHQFYTIFLHSFPIFFFNVGRTVG